MAEHELELSDQQSLVTPAKPIVLAMTGASGGVYAIRLLQALLLSQRTVHCIISESGAAVLQQELGIAPELDGTNLDQLLHACHNLLLPDEPTAAMEAAWARARDGHLMVHHHQNYFTPVASGSFLTGGMVVCPCSGSTLSGISRSAGQNLIQRAAEVHLKERRRLIVVPRETPLSLFQLENMQRLAQAGVVVLPAAPGWYHGVGGLVDLVDFVVARVLDQLEIPNHCIRRWGQS